MNAVEPTRGGTTSELNNYRPSNMECLREYEINLRFLSRGCIVRIGCKEIAFESSENAMKELNDYVNNTYEVREKWLKILG
jgi:hypothetical protein